MAPFSLSTRPRRSLPEGYKFGDAALTDGQHLHRFDVFDPCWRAFRCACGVSRHEWERVRDGLDIDVTSPLVASTPITSDYATDYSQRSPYAEMFDIDYSKGVTRIDRFTTDRDLGDETPTRRLRRREA